MLTWLEAAAKVLDEEKKALNYNEITRLIFERGYKTGGATPNYTVNRDIHQNIQKEGEKSIFVKVDKGEFILRKFVDDRGQLLTYTSVGNVGIPTKSPAIDEQIEQTKIITSFGIYWDRHFIDWKKSTPDLLGMQQVGASEVNFKEQKGIYLLHDSRETIYIGQAIQQSLGQRLRQHTSDRLNSRWNRFSWFGFYPISENGELHIKREHSNLSVELLGDMLEAILIESIEPRQNRKQGNTFFGLEYLQQEAPEVKKRKAEELLKDLLSKQ